MDNYCEKTETASNDVSHGKLSGETSEKTMALFSPLGYLLPLIQHASWLTHPS